MRYFEGMKFGWGDHAPRCSVWIDTTFPDFYALNFAAAGTVYGEDSRGTRRRWTAPVAWWTQPGRRYAYGCGPGETWDHFYITLRGPRIRAMFTQDLVPSGSTWRGAVANPEEMRLDFLRLLDLLKTGRASNPRAVHLLEGMFLSLHQPAPPGDIDSRAQRLRRLAEKIRLHPEQDWRMDEQAEKLGLSPVHFRRLFRREFGAPGHQYLLRARLDLAARLLRLTDQPVKNVAEACGIPDIFYFTRLFRQRMGMAPARYRRHAGLIGWKETATAPGPA